MWPDRVSNPGHLTYESGALLTALRGPATGIEIQNRLGSLSDFLFFRFLHKLRKSFTIYINS